jgi:hypothetical protein
MGRDLSGFEAFAARESELKERESTLDKTIQERLKAQQARQLEEEHRLKDAEKDKKWLRPRQSAELAGAEKEMGQSGLRLPIFEAP